MFLKGTKEAIKNPQNPLLTCKRFLKGLIGWHSFPFCSLSHYLKPVSCTHRHAVYAQTYVHIHTQMHTHVYWLTAHQIVWEPQHSFLVPGHPSLAFPALSDVDVNSDSLMHLCKHNGPSELGKHDQNQTLTDPQPTDPQDDHSSTAATT